MNVIVMAGGLGERLRPLTQVIPKPLLPVGEKSVLEIIIMGLKACGFKDIFLALNYQSLLFEAYFGDGSRWGVRIGYTREAQPLGTAGPIKLLQDKLHEPFLVINGDILTNLDFRELATFHKDSGAVATVCTKNVRLPLHYGVVHGSGNLIEKIDEKPDFGANVVAGIYCLSPAVLGLIPEESFYTMIDLLHALIAKQMKVLQFNLSEYYWLDIGQMDDYEKAQDMYNEGVLLIPQE